MIQLSEIGNFSQQVAQAISSVLGIEVQVIDENLRIIAATGISINRINEIFDPSSASSFVIKSRQPIVIEQAGKHQICLQCSYRSHCIDLAEICYPILTEGKCAGVIALIAYEEHQKKALLDRMNTLFQFIEQMSRMLAYVLRAYELNKQVSLLMDTQKAIMNSIQEGLITFDSKNRVIFANHSATVLLGITQENLMLMPVAKLFQSCEDILASTQTGITLETEFLPLPSINSKHFFGTVTPLILYNGEQGAVICFRDIDAIPRIVRGLLRKERKITFEDIKGMSQSLKKIKRIAFQVAKNDSSILISGESGTGKEMFARAIHYASPRSSGPLICINCGAIPDNLLESELFGYEEGAFTGAKKGGKPGQFELANNGTLFLDEIGDMPLHLQVKLLRVLEERQIQRIGGTKSFYLNTRIIAATNKNLKELVDSHEFRSDLYYRLNVVPLHIPPLRERSEDIVVYVMYFIDKYIKILNSKVTSISPEALKILTEYSWPGNVRELENVIEYAINMEIENTITVGSLPEQLLTNRNKPDYVRNLDEAEKHLITDTLNDFKATPHSIEQAAKSLGISRATLYRKIKKFNLSQN